MVCVSRTGAGAGFDGNLGPDNEPANLKTPGSSGCHAGLTGKDPSCLNKTCACTPCKIRTNRKATIKLILRFLGIFIFVRKLRLDFCGIGRFFKKNLTDLV